MAYPDFLQPVHYTIIPVVITASGFLVWALAGPDKLFNYQPAKTGFATLFLD